MARTDATATAASRGGGRAGRPSGRPANREAILVAARAQFAAGGYDATTIRSVAAEAGVDPALVHHYFGSKDQLFAAALDLTVTPSRLVEEILAGPRHDLGERLVRVMIATWDAGHPANPMIALLRSAAAHEDSARMVREFITREVLGRVAASLDLPRPTLRAALTASQLIGLAMARSVLRIEPLASADVEELVACYAPTLQRYLTGPLPGDS